MAGKPCPGKPCPGKPGDCVTLEEVPQDASLDANKQLPHLVVR